METIGNTRKGSTLLRKHRAHKDILEKRIEIMRKKHRKHKEHNIEKTIEPIRKTSGNNRKHKEDKRRTIQNTRKPILKNNRKHKAILEKE